MTPIKEQLANELHKPARRNYQRRYVTLKGIADLWQADLVDMKAHASANSGYKYLLTIIDCFSKLAWVVPLKSKHAGPVADAFRTVFEQAPSGPPRNLQTDDGTEFFNAKVNALTRKYKINHYSTYSTAKCSIVERFNRTLKTRMFKRFTVNGNYRWIDMLPELLAYYNNSIHRTIGMKPADVTKQHEPRLLQRYHATATTKFRWKKPKFRVGDHVRISKYKTLFEKGYTPNWSTEIFRVVKVQRTLPTTYHLEDYTGEQIKGGFYEQELQKTRNKDVYLVEKVLKERGNRAYVKWLGFDNSHNSWIKKSDVV